MPDERPLISVVMCAYNGLPYIRDAVADILAQTYTHWELIIVDDGSNDGTREWLSQNCVNDPRIRLYFNEKNLGYVANKNYGHQLAKGVFITQLDNDDRCTADRLEKLVILAENHPEIKVFASGYRRIDSEGNVYDEVKPAENIVLTEKPSDGYPFWFPALFVHHNVFEEMGYFDPYFAGALGDDIYWTVKVNTRYPIYCFKEALYDYRNNPNSITNDYGNVRKLVIPAILLRLFEQRKKEGSDFLERKEMEQLKNMENELIEDGRFMSEQYRIWAAKAIDKNDLSLGKKLLKKAFQKNRFNTTILNTTVYLLKKQFSK